MSSQALIWTALLMAGSAALASPAAAAPEGLTPVTGPDLRSRPVFDTHRSELRYQTMVTPERPQDGPPDEAVEQRMASRADLGVEALARGLALQPSLRLGNVGGGLRSAWDSAETHPPNALKVGRQWEPEGGASDLMRMAFGDLTDEELHLHWRKRGAVFYHDLPLVRGERKWIRHRYLYYFASGYDAWGSRLQPHVVWVEVRERLNPSEAEHAQWLARARGELAEKAATLKRLSSGGGPQAGEARQVLERVEALAEGEPPIPLHLAVDQVLLADPMPVRGGQPWKLRLHKPQALEWEGDRLILYVAESSHRFVVRPKDLGWFEECDPPWIREPREDGKLPLVDLREHRQPENPIAARDKGEAVPHLPGFTDSPVMVLGFDGAFQLSPASFQEPPADWVRDVSLAATSRGSQPATTAPAGGQGP